MIFVIKLNALYGTTNQNEYFKDIGEMVIDIIGKESREINTTEAYSSPARNHQNHSKFT